MNRRISLSLVAGFFLYLLTILSACLTCLDIQDKLFTALMTTAFVLVTGIVIALFIRNRASLKMQLVSGFLWQLAFWALFLLDSAVGITRSLVFFPEDNFAGGLIIVMFWLSCTTLSVVGFLFTALVQFIKRSGNAK